MPFKEEIFLGCFSCRLASRVRIDGTPVIKVILLLSTYSRQVLGLKLRRITIHPPTYKVGVGPPECKPPRRHIHCNVSRVEREMHNYIVCRKHFVYIVERNTLWCACCARSLQTNNLIIYMRLKIYRRIFFGGIFYIVLKKNMSLRKFDFFTGVVYGDNYLWSMRSDFRLRMLLLSRLTHCWLVCSSVVV